jgi:uroporphyrin-III C-methyltransferase/precorrin-2 dehydrogenase/sirohydrochlorin ferrochelatase/precorrin-2 dehydrogenase/sirohydrochlorin ferrochelatase
MAYFPMFVDIENKMCLVVGGGAVALRKVRVLLDFGACVKVVAERMEPELSMLAQPKVILCERKFSEDDLEGCAMVIAATEDDAVNHEIAELSKAHGIPINAVDRQEDCTFIFPSYVREQNLVGAISSSGNSPLLTQYLKKKLARELTGELGAINEYLGSIRPIVKASVPAEAQRRQVYRNILLELLVTESTSLPDARLQDHIERACAGC